MNKRPTAGSLLCMLCAISGISLGAEAQEGEDTLVLREIRKLSSQVMRLETKIDHLEELLSETNIGSSGSQESSQEKDTLVDQVLNAVNRNTELINYPWMDEEKWAMVKEGMTPEDILNILGEPTLEDPSLHKRIDFVYTYRGRRPANGEKVMGKIKFYRNKAVDIETP